VAHGKSSPQVVRTQPCCCNSNNLGAFNTRRHIFLRFGKGAFGGKWPPCGNSRQNVAASRGSSRQLFRMSGPLLGVNHG
jgi:hypothetical protein